MKVIFGKDGLTQSHQGDFPETTECQKCGGNSRIGFTYFEDDEPYLCNMYDTTGKKGGLWLHDACAVAVYFCKDCLNVTSLYNQA